LRSEDLGGASMSISNLGSICGGESTPLVNSPEARSWVSVEAPLSLSWDHRVVTGAEAARFLTRYETLFADPRRLLI
jgi:pyruvate/2-oxoglutarate dehydrogenase complex dihydrolipoamide acyltransferase (E2) component